MNFLQRVVFQCCCRLPTPLIMKIFLAACSLFFITIMNAQITHNVGFFADFNLTNVTSSDLPVTMIARPSFGGGISYNRLGNVDVGVYLNFAPRGFKTTFDFTNEQGEIIRTESIRYNFDYFELPIKIGKSFHVKERSAVSVSIGLAPAIQTRAVVVYPEDGFFVEDVETIQDIESVNSFDLGGFIEVKDYFTLSDLLSIFGSLRLQHSLTSFQLSSLYPESSGRHNGLNVSVGMAYRL